jgi:hypothetical protein
MSISSEKPSSERPAEIGPPPYYHQSDCNICRKQDGLKTGSELLDAPIPGGYVGCGFWVSRRRRREASTSASAAARSAQDRPSTLLPGSSSL